MQRTRIQRARESKTKGQIVQRLRRLETHCSIKHTAIDLNEIRLFGFGWENTYPKTSFGDDVPVKGVGEARRERQCLF